MTALSRAFKRVIVAFPAGAGDGRDQRRVRHDRRVGAVESPIWLAVATLPAISSALASFVTVIVLSAVERQNRRFVQEALGRYLTARWCAS
ncbi:MAG: hypothetical protein IPQ07_20820 [Myxococcales bacterium]|nr:hypothetical protein [Myxococcales bacterium]